MSLREELGRKRWACAGLLTSVLLCTHPSAVAQLNSLDQGYRQMYNLDFAGAHETFAGWKQAHPEDPMGPASNAAAYLFSELDRLHVLEIDLFADNTKFLEREKPVPDPNVKNAFEKELGKSAELASAVLARSPRDGSAQLANILVDGLRGDYLALIEKRNFAALSFTKAGRVSAEKLIAQDPTNYDAYLALGIENYLLGVNAAPIRWFLRLGGAETDKELGLRNLRITAEKGRYLAPFARLLLAVAAVRDKDNQTAKKLLGELAEQFPRNPLYKRELDRIH